MDTLAIIIGANPGKVQAIANQVHYEIMTQILPFDELITFSDAPPKVDPEISVGDPGYVAIARLENP